MIRTPVFVVPFGTDPSETAEIVPADYITQDNGYKIYEIADGAGRWMKASPDAHKAYVAHVNGQLKQQGQAARQVLEGLEILQECSYFIFLPGNADCKILFLWQKQGWKVILPDEIEVKGASWLIGELKKIG